MLSTGRQRTPRPRSKYRLASTRKDGVWTSPVLGAISCLDADCSIPAHISRLSKNDSEVDNLVQADPCIMW